MSDYEHAILPEDNMRHILLENLPCITMILEKGTRKILYSNKMARDVGALPGEVCYDKISQRSDPCPWCVAPDVWATDDPQRLQIEYRGNHYEVQWLPLSDQNYVHYIFDITKYKQAEKALRFSNDFLRKANLQTSKQALLDGFVEEIQTFTECEAVGVRLLDEDGGIPYESYLGFSKEFYERECGLSVRRDQCMCVDVVNGKTDSKYPFFTEGGSFYTNSTTDFLAAISEEQKTRSRNECNRFGYESLALIPICTGNSIMGLIHLADSNKNKVHLELVETIEKIAVQMSSAINRINAEQKLEQHAQDLEKLVEERTQELLIANLQLKAEIKERQKAEKEAEEHYQEFLHLSRLTTVGDMASGLAHELNQPLCAIRTFTNVCLRTSENGIEDLAKFRENLEVITSQAKRAGEIINGIKAFVQKRTPHHTTIDINETIGSSISLLESLLQKNNISLSLQLDNELPFILADPIQIEQVLINLVTNAVESMQNVTTREHHLCLKTSLASTDKLEVSIRDSGEGFSGTVDEIIKPFFSTKKEGLGIGLSVSRFIIESHGGTLCAERNSDHGSTFRFTLPIVKNNMK